MKHRLKVAKDGREVGAKGSWGFPVSFGYATEITDYEGARFECHFHPETEITEILAGEMYYRANDRVFVLRAGDMIFVNDGVMHAGWQKGAESCTYRTLNFATVMVSGHENSRIGERYVLPLLREFAMPFLLLRAEDAGAADTAATVREAFALRQSRQDGFELLIKAALCRFWFHLYRVAKERENVVPDRNAECIKRAIALMEARYAEKLTLAELARACGLSRSEFCRTFRKYTGRTPFEYLQHLRVRRALPLLEGQEVPVTEVAARVGFSGGSYFAEVFRRFFCISPTEYRKKNAE